MVVTDLPGVQGLNDRDSSLDRTLMKPRCLEELAYLICRGRGCVYVLV